MSHVFVLTILDSAQINPPNRTCCSSRSDIFFAKATWGLIRHQPGSFVVIASSLGGGCETSRQRGSCIEAMDGGVPQGSASHRSFPVQADAKVVGLSMEHRWNMDLKVWMFAECSILLR